MKKTNKMFVEMVHVMNNGSYKLSRFIDVFLKLPDAHQDSFVRFLQESVGNEKWREWSEDRYKYIDFVKTCFFHFSGEEELDQPNYKSLTYLIRDYLKSGDFKIAEDFVYSEGDEIDLFKEELESI